MFSIYKNNKSLYVNMINVLVTLYIISIYIWSDDGEMVIYSTGLCALLIVGISPIMLKNGIKIPYKLIPIILFDIFCIASIFWAWDPELSFTISVRTLPLLTVFSIVLYNYIKITSQEDFLLQTIFVAGLFLAAYTIFSQPGGFAGYIEGLLLGYRMGDNVNNVNVIGLACCTSIIIAFYKAYNDKIYKYYYSLPLLVFVTLGTGSNKALAMLLLGGFLVILSKMDKQKIYTSCFKILLATLVFALIVYALVDLPIFSTIANRAERTFNAFTGSGMDDGSAAVRIMLVKAGWNQFLETPILGIGINNGASIAFASVGHKYYLHNNYIELLVGCGIIGTFLFYSSFFMLLKTFYMGMKRKDSLSMIMMIFFVCWLIMQYGYVCYSSKITFVYLALGTAVANKIENTQSVKEK